MTATSAGALDPSEPDPHAHAEALRVEWVTTSDGLRALRPAWDALLARGATRTVFLTFDWAWTWWEHFGADQEPWVCVVRRGGRIVALVPWLRSRVEGFRQIHFLGHKLSDRKDFIIDPRDDRAAVIRAALTALDARGGWDLLFMDRLPADSPNCAPLRDVLAAHPPDRWTLAPRWTAPYVEIAGDWSRYWKGLSRNFRSYRSHNLNRLRKQADGAEPRWRLSLEPGEIDAWIDRFARMHAAQWGEREGHSLFQDPAMVRFHRALAHRFAATGRLRATSVEIGGEEAAMNFALEHGGVFSFLLTCYEPRFSHGSPGLMLLIQLLEDAFARELREFDFMSGGEPYKQRFAPALRELYAFGFFAPGARGMLARLWFFTVRPGVDAFVQQRLPGLRRRLRALRGR
jgi:CelD/BcsL family acetyltransferase involved in cellulose biosynthesis